MSIQEKCLSVDSLLSRLEKARQKQTLADALSKRASELEEVESPFLAVMLSIRALQQRGIVSDSRLPDTAKSAERVGAMRQQLATEPQDVTKGQAFNQLCRAVRNLTEQYDVLATASWNEHVKTKAPVVDKSVLDQHRDSPRHANIVYQLERLLQGTKTLVKKPPADAQALDWIEEQWKAIRQYLSDLPVSDDPEVQAFLNAAVSSEGAALDLLTATVKRWLKENNMLSDFCVRRSK